MLKMRWRCAVAALALIQNTSTSVNASPRRAQGDGAPDGVHWPLPAAEGGASAPGFCRLVEGCVVNCGETADFRCPAAEPDAPRASVPWWKRCDGVNDCPPRANAPAHAARGLRSARIRSSGLTVKFITCSPANRCQLCYRAVAPDQAVQVRRDDERLDDVPAGVVRGRRARLREPAGAGAGGADGRGRLRRGGWGPDQGRAHGGGGGRGAARPGACRHAGVSGGVELLPDRAGPPGWSRWALFPSASGFNGLANLNRRGARRRDGTAGGSTATPTTRTRSSG